MDAATRWLLIERWGKPFALEIEFGFLRRHQLTHFIDGATKLGIIDKPHPILCAQYHCLSNMLGGLDMGYAEDDERAWVFYFPPEAYAGSPLLSTPAVPAMTPDFYIEDFRAWHSNNGVLLENPRLQFVATDLVHAGGPYNAGYWHEVDHDLGPDERLLLKLGELRGEPGPPPKLGPNDWPQARRDAALRKYSAEYALGGLAHVAQYQGLLETARIAEDSHRAVFLAWARPLLHMYEIEEPTSVARVARLFRVSFELIQDEFDQAEDAGDVLLTHRKTRLCVPQYQWETPPRMIEEAFARAWTTISRAVGNEVRVTVEKSRWDGDGDTVWRFTETGN